MDWLNSKLDGYSIDNFSTAWNSGIALGTVVFACDKDLCTDVANWRPGNAINNLRFAMEAAWQCLHIPQLLRPSEIIDVNVSERAVMVYLSQFINLLHDKDNNRSDITGKRLSSIVEDGGSELWFMRKHCD